TVEAFIQLYQWTLEESHLLFAYELTEQIISEFYNKEEALFKMLSGKPTITEHYDYTDSVIPSGNSMMAMNLWVLGTYFNNEHFTEIYERMTQRVMPTAIQHPQWYSKWISVLMLERTGLKQYIFTGENK